MEGMILGLLMGCNNEGEDPQKVFLKSVVSLGNEFLDVFTSFGEMAGSALGFKREPKKSTVEGTKEKLEKIVADMEKENNPNAVAVKTKVDELIKNKLNNIIEGAKKASEAIGTDASEKIGNVADQTQGGVVGGNDVDKLVEGIKGIVDVVLKNVGSADVGTDKKASDVNSGRSASTAGTGEAGKVFGTSVMGSNHKASAADAVKAVGAVTGTAILQAMAQVGGDSAKLAKSTTGDVTTAPKDATIAGGIALRAMAKKGKFANGNSDGPVVIDEVKRAAVSAVTKALDTLTIAIRKTIDEGLREVKKAMNINANDSFVISETGAAGK